SIHTSPAALAMDGGPQLKWTWKSSGTVALADLGDPTVVDGDPYTACLLDADPSGAPGTIFVAPNPPLCSPFSHDFLACWKAERRGFALKAKSNESGLGIRITTGGPKKAKIAFNGQGVATTDVGLPPFAAPVTFRLERSGSANCWDASFS